MAVTTCLNSFGECAQPENDAPGPGIGETCRCKWEDVLRHNELTAWKEGFATASHPSEPTVAVLARSALPYHYKFGHPPV